MSGNVSGHCCGEYLAGTRCPVCPYRKQPASVADIADEKLLERAVKAARPKKGRAPRWSAVADLFAPGSTYAAQLCRRFGLDPDQEIRRRREGR